MSLCIGNKRCRIRIMNKQVKAMKAMILAAGLGTRLKPWTLHHPKALVPVGGVPMLERVIVNLKGQGFDYIVVNVHHFSDQIIDFLNNKEFGVKVVVSDEMDRLLDTGGAILNASELLRLNEGPALIHNVDILSNADLVNLMKAHEDIGSDSTLLVSERESTRKLIFNEEMKLTGWHNLSEGVYRPDNYDVSPEHVEYAFSGIHVVGEKVVEEMRRIESDNKFSIVDFLLSHENHCNVTGYLQKDLSLMDIGKPATLSQARFLV